MGTYMALLFEEESADTFPLSQLIIFVQFILAVIYPHLS